MDKSYGYYFQCDRLLKIIDSKKNGKIIRTEILKRGYKENHIYILKINSLVVDEVIGDISFVAITSNGKQHLKAGGYTKVVDEFLPEPDISFKEHLNASTNLLTIFGILNALITFSNQDIKTLKSELSIFQNGMLLINTCSYVLSILTLREIIKVTLETGVKKWYFHAYYLALCLITLGVSLMFLGQYVDLLKVFGAVVLVMALLFGILCGIWALIIWIFIYSIGKKYPNWSKRNLKQIVSVAFFISCPMVWLIFHFLDPYIKILADFFLKQ